MVWQPRFHRFSLRLQSRLASPGAAPYLLILRYQAMSATMISVRASSFFVIDSDPNEPDGTMSTSTQALCCKAGWRQLLNPGRSSICTTRRIVLIGAWPQRFICNGISRAGCGRSAAGHDHTMKELMLVVSLFRQWLGGRRFIHLARCHWHQVRYNAQYGACW